MSGSLSAPVWLPLLVLLWPLWLQRRPEQQSPLWARRSLILLINLLTLRYLAWRVSDSLNLSSTLSTALSLVLLLAEGWLLLTGLIPLWLAWRPFPDRRHEADARWRQWQQSSWRPSVDILVPTRGEPLAVLERSLVGCCAQTYPRTTVWVLDDSGRPEVRQLASSLGCRYLHRPERHGAKAGNLNHGLRHGRGELVAVFDADFIPQRHFLERCIGFLQEPDVALVQTPQTFINADPVMRNLRMEPWLLSDEESFYRWIEPVRDGWGAVVCAGTAFLVRREALNSVGGFVEQAISEDFVTGIALRRQGWRLRYLQEKLSAGLAAESMADFVRQRQRWAAGTLQSLRMKEGPLGGTGLSAGQRLAYLEGVVHWFNNLPRLVLLLMPLSYGLLGVVPIRLTPEAAIAFLLPLWATLLLSLGWLNRGSRAAFLSELTGWMLTVPLTVTVISQLFGHLGGFRVTPKHQRRDRGSWSLPLVAPLLLLILLNGFNLAGLLLPTTPLLGLALQGQPVGLVWALLNLLSLLVALRACWDPAASDPAPWQAIALEARLEDAGGHSHPCRITAISEQGVELTVAKPSPPLVSSTCLRWSPDVPPLSVMLRAQTQGRLALDWGELSTHQRRALLRWLFTRPGCWVDRQAQGEWRALLALIARIPPPWRGPAPLARSLIPQTLKPTAASGSR
jgi:cellulose synthase (UDP-forming)